MQERRWIKFCGVDIFIKLFAVLLIGNEKGTKKIFELLKVYSAVMTFSAFKLKLCFFDYR